MPTSEVTLVLSDWTKGGNGKKSELPQISMSSKIIEVKKSVLQTLGRPSEQPDSILLFVGSLHLEDEKLVKEYNRSNRTKLNVDVYERVDLKLRVKTLQHWGAGGCVCVPLWSFLCRQTININIPDHKTVGDLKKRVAEELNDPGRYTPENIKLTFNNNMLFEDKQLLKDAGLQPDSTLTLFVDCCYWTKSRKDVPEEPAEVPQQAGYTGAKEEDVAGEDAADQKPASGVSDDEQANDEAAMPSSGREE